MHDPRLDPRARADVPAVFPQAVPNRATGRARRGRTLGVFVDRGRRGIFGADGPLSVAAPRRRVVRSHHQPAPELTTKTRELRALSESPLADSNRRPPPTIFGSPVWPRAAQ
jgi:hypothetical protein